MAGERRTTDPHPMGDTPMTPAAALPPGGPSKPKQLEGAWKAPMRAPAIVCE